jgi:hypothetical protein
MPHHSDHYAIVVGIEGGGGVASATGVRADAIAVANWLHDEAGGGVPAGNLHFVASGSTPTADDRGLRPQRFEFDRALRNIGVQSGARVGRRLYFYFAGHASARPGGEVALLMEETDPQVAGNGALDLRRCVSALSNAGAFDELVVWVDAQRIDVPLSPAPPPSWPMPTRATSAALFSLIVVSQRRGAVTQLLIKALHGAAADARGFITAESLGQFVRDQNPQVTVELTIPHEITFGAGAGAPATGTLAVEVPHWTAKITILDDRYRPIPQVGEIKDEIPGHYVSKTDLRPGIYQVEVTLDGVAEEHLVFVSPAGASIAVDSWRRLKIKSAAPFIGAAANNPEQTRLAAEWSKIATWNGSRPGPADSRLFIFARALGAERNPNFFADLTLLDASGELVTDFADSVAADPASGCIAFNAALSAGFYVLRRRRRSGVRSRSQPLYLCPNWETHIFLAVHRKPSLRRWTYNMAPLGAGYTPDDESGLAATAVTEALYYGSDITALIDSGRMRALYAGSGSNPWLGILAAYALLQHRERPGGAFSGDAERNRESRLTAVTGFLKDTIVTHPDVWALLLDDAEVESKFTHPPLLRAGLARVKAYATKRPGIIPLDSLTDCVIDSLVPNSAWTAWRYLDRQPVGWAADETPRRWTDAPLQEAARARRTGFSPTAYGSALPPSTPVFNLAAASRSRNTAATTPPETQAIAGSWAEAAVLQFAGTASNAGFAELPEKLVLEPDKQIAHLLSMVDPKRVATGLGVTYERAAQALGQLREASQPGTAGAGAAPRPALVEQAIQAITENVLTSADKKSRQSPASAGFTIEECVSKLSEQADHWATQAAGASDDPRPANFAERFRAAADALLVRADYVVITEAGGRLLYGNGAFRCLVGSAARASQRNAALRAWRAALQRAPVGQSTVSLSSGPGLVLPQQSQHEWQLKRIAIESGDRPRVRGYINVLRRSAAPHLTADALPRIAKICSELTLYSSLYALSPAANATYLDNIEAGMAQLEEAVFA